VPGIVYASNYDLGGQAVGYQDSAQVNPGTYRTDGVDLKSTSDTASAGTGYVLGWRTTGEWTRYTVNANPGQYTVSARVESASSTGKFHVAIDGATVIAAVSVPLTGPWDTAASWKTLSLGTVTLTAGVHVVTLFVDAPWFDINYLAFAAAAPTPTPTPIPVLKYVQGAYATPQTPTQTVPVTYPAAQASGNLNVVIVGWNDSVNVVASVTDSKGNLYQRATGPVVFHSLSQSIYYAKNIVGGSNTVTVTFSGLARYPDIRVLEYSGINTSNPFDAAAGTGGTGTSASSGAITTSSSSELLLAANVVSNSTAGPGTGFTQRILTVPDSDIVEDKIVNAIGSYAATTPLGIGDWVMQIVAFRAAAQPN
jgi:Carbohydrate binding module (family 6)